MKQAKDLYLVCSPLHLFFCLKNITASAQSLKPILIVVFTASEKNNQQMQCIIDKYLAVFDGIYFLKMRKKNGGIFESIRYINDIKKIITAVGWVKNIYMPDPRVEVFQILVSNVHYEKLVVTDDGMATVNIVVDYLQKRKLFSSYYKNMFKGVALCWLGLRVREPKNIIFRSIFDLRKVLGKELKALTWEKTVLNGELSAGKSTDSTKCYFIGQKLSSVGILDCDRYIFYIKDFIRRFISQNQTLVYFAHRGDAPEVLEALANIDNVRVVFLEVPVELAFVQEAHLPEKISSFYSTALFTLSAMFPQVAFYSIKLVAQDLAKLTVAQRQAIQRCYDVLVQTDRVTSIEVSEDARDDG